MTSAEKRLPETDGQGTSVSALVESLRHVGVRRASAGIWDDSVRVTDVRHDSRKVRPGELFVALPGENTDGLDYLEEATSRGARAVMVPAGRQVPTISIPVLEADDVRLGMAWAAEAVHQQPSRQIQIVGITGTNGKTTTAWLLEQALKGTGARPARLGTLGYAFGGRHADGSLTTPEADDISRFLRAVADDGATHAVMEASSHALSQGRIDALRFAAAGFTNLTQDHLDYHKTMDAYARAKRRLMVDLRPGVAVVNIDDPEGDRLARDLLGRPLLRVGRERGAEVHPVRAETDALGIRATIRLPSGEVSIRSRMVGDHNLDNLLLALGLVEALGLDVQAAAQALGETPAVPGRLERCDTDEDDICVLVDYAHTPDALLRALDAVRTFAQGEVICVFGCGGDRDPDKRPKMGDAVGRSADLIFLTTDNPRTEAPEAITRQVEPGLRQHSARYTVVLDRREAIAQAVSSARPGDVVLVAGKGHETYQIIGRQRFDFDDRIEARRALQARRARRGGA
jgi:UDP-N-acetylmuramoyl-L-alanyl-D-glutamate--2,6-diaminopimelate ligase